MTDDELLDRLDADLKAAIIACEKADARNDRLVAAIRQAIEAMERASILLVVSGKNFRVQGELDAALAACRAALEGE